jgi:glycosyltransferase involved in cell wall biosynthesis
MYRLFAKIVLCAGGLREYFKILKLPDDRFVTINNFVDSDKFRPPEDTLMVRSDSFDIGADTFVISLVGHLSEIKGQKILIRALKRLVDEGFKVHALLAGGDNDPSLHNERELKTLARQLGAEASITFLGKIGDTRIVYHSSDVLVLPSYREGLPLVVLEAMACGLPIVATAIDGTPDAVENEVSGFLIDTGDVEMLVEKLRHLIQDRSLREHMGRNARERVESFFSKDEFNRKFLELIEGQI